MRFQVPQFIDTEETLFVGLTLKQFLIVAVGVVLLFIDFTIFKISAIFFIIGAVIASATLFIAKGKIEGEPVYAYVFDAFLFMFQTKRLIFTPPQDESKQ